MNYQLEYLRANKQQHITGFNPCSKIPKLSLLLTRVTYLDMMANKKRYVLKKANLHSLTPPSCLFQIIIVIIIIIVTSWQNLKEQCFKKELVIILKLMAENLKNCGEKKWFVKKRWKENLPKKVEGKEGRKYFVPTQFFFGE